MDQNNALNCIQSVHNRIKPDFNFKSKHTINTNIFGWRLMSVVPPLSAYYGHQKMVDMLF